MMKARPRRHSRDLPIAGWTFALLGICLIGGLAGCGGDDGGPPTQPPQAPVVHLLSPNGGESFVGGATVEITWTATDSDTPAASLRLTLELSLDGGSSWLPVATAEANDGTFTWAVPAVTTGQALIRATATDGSQSASDTSDSPFTVTTTPPPPNNVLSVEDGSAAPGAVVEVPLRLQNQDSVGRIEVRVRFDPTGAETPVVQLSGRGVGMQLTAVPSGADTVRIVISQQNNAVIAPGDGPVALLSFRLVGAAGSHSEVLLRQARLYDADGAGLGVRTDDGRLTVLVVDTAETLTAEGWAAFEAGDLATARQAFVDAIGLDAAYGPAYAGRGWVELSEAITSGAFRAAETSFTAALARGEGGADVYGGRAAARLALGSADLAAAAQDAGAALQTAPDFVFPHRDSFDSNDLRLIAAFAEAGRGGRFTEARNQADQVEESGIRVGDSSTWTVDGVPWPTFEAAVVAWLAKLSATYAG